MAPIGTELVDLLAGLEDGDEEQQEWRRQTIALFALLEQSYPIVRHEVQAYLRLSGHEEEADAIRRLRGIRRSSRPSKPAAVPETNGGETVETTEQS